MGRAKGSCAMRSVARARASESTPASDAMTTRSTPARRAGSVLRLRPRTGAATRRNAATHLEPCEQFGPSGNEIVRDICAATV